MRPALLLASVASAFAILAATLSATRAAEAQTVDRAWGVTHERPGRHDGEVSFDVRDYWLRSMPTFSMGQTTPIGVRTVGDGVLPSTGDQHFLGFGVDTKYIYNQRYEFPIFGLVGGGAIGQSPRVVTSLDGTMVDMKPWTAGAFTFLLPGVGLRFKERRWMFSANVRMAATFVWEQVSFASGRSMDDSPPTLWASTFGARAHLEVCRRLDASERLCLFIEPHLYEFNAMNGGSAGLRWEIGQ